MARSTPWAEDLKMPYEQWEPYALYGDEAEYTVSKEKILVIFISYSGSRCWHYFLI